MAMLDLLGPEKDFFRSSSQGFRESQEWDVFSQLSDKIHWNEQVSEILS